jgi:mRNA-degrading endonuclease RelE of RelBE toxin-antitoxin system
MQHKWLLSFEANVPEQLRKLPPKDRMAVFRAIAELLLAENPASVAGVKKLIEKRFDGMLRQRQGDYHILFELQPGKEIHQDHTYKGKLHLVSVIHRSQAYLD